MGRKRSDLVDPIERAIRIEYPHDQESRSKVVEFCSQPWVSEVLCFAEVGEENEQLHYHIVGKFTITVYALKQNIQKTFNVIGSAYSSIAPDKKGRYEGACRYAAKGTDCVFSKGLDHEKFHAEYWRIHREVKAKKEVKSIKEVCLDHFRGKVRLTKAEVIRYVCQQYHVRGKGYNDYQITSIAHLVLHTNDPLSFEAYVNNLADRML